MAKQAEPIEGYLDEEFARFRTQRLTKGKEAHLEPTPRSTRSLAKVETPDETATSPRGTARLTKLDEVLAAKREEAKATTMRLPPVEAAAEPEPPVKHHPHCALLDLDPSRPARACNCKKPAPTSQAHGRPQPDSKAHPKPQPDSKAHPKPQPDSKAHPKPAQPETKAHAKPEAPRAERLEPTPSAGTARGTRRIAVLPPEEAGDDFERFRAQRLKEAQAPARAEHAAPVPATEAEVADELEQLRAPRARDSKRHRVAAAAEAPVDLEFEKFRAQREKELEEERRADEALAAVPVVERAAETGLLGAVVEEKAPADDDGMFFGTNHRERTSIRAAAREHRGDTPADGLDVHGVEAKAEPDAKADEAKRRAPPPPPPTRE